GAAEVVGAAIGSQALVFRPGRVQPGHYTFAVGTAGSATLVLQTVLPALVTARGESTLELEGGTHNPWAPPYDFLERAFLPLLGRMGPRVTPVLERRGFYPAGGGRFTVGTEAVAERVANEVKRHLGAEVPVGEHLADQLLVPLALAGGGSFVTLPLTSHAQTNIDIVRRFLDLTFAVEPVGHGAVRVAVNA